MTPLDGAHDLREELRRLGLAQASLAPDVGVEVLVAGAEQHVRARGTEHDLYDVGDVRVSTALPVGREDVAVLSQRENLKRTKDGELKNGM